MAIGTGGTFAAEAKNIGMGLDDIATLKDKLTFPGEKGIRSYEFKGKKYQVKYVNSGGDTTLLSIQAV